MNHHTLRNTEVRRDEHQLVLTTLLVAGAWQLLGIATAWAQATIDMPPLSDWLNCKSQDLI